MQFSSLLVLANTTRFLTQLVSHFGDEVETKFELAHTVVTTSLLLEDLAVVHRVLAPLLYYHLCWRTGQFECNSLCYHLSFEL